MNSLAQVPFKPIEFLSRDVGLERRADGSIILQSNHKLKPYEKCVPAFLAKWAEDAPAGAAPRAAAGLVQIDLR